MKKTIKLRDMTEEQFEKWMKDCCTNTKCTECPFRFCNCDIADNYNFFDHKDMYSDKFLDQTVEIEVPDLLTEEEKALLNKLLEVSAFNIYGINFIICDGYVLVELSNTNPCEQNDFFHFKKGMFKGIEETKRYAPSDLGLEDK